MLFLDRPGVRQHNEWMQYVVRAVVLGVVWLAGSNAALGQQTTAPAVADTLAASPVVVVGRIASLSSAWDLESGTLVTFVDVTVEQRLRGASVPDRIVLKQLGGERDGLGLWIAGQARFLAGERALLFLSVSPRDRTLHTTALGAGRQPADDATIAAAVAALTARPAVSASFEAVPPDVPRAGVGPLYALLPTGSYPARWHEVDEDLQVQVRHPSGVPAGWSGSPANATAAVNAWRGSGMELDLRDGGATLPLGQCPAAFTGDGRIAIAYNDGCAVPDAPDTWVIGGGYYTSGDLRTVGGITYQKFIQGFVVVNDSGPASGSAGCLQDAITHGLGHALGLGHTDSVGASMQPLPYATCSAGARSLGGDDVTGITAIYRGIPAGPNPPAAPTAITAQALLSTVLVSWTPSTSGGPAQRYLLDAGTASGVYNLGSILLNTATPAATFSGVPVGTYFIRVRAQNITGTSGPSPEASVVVGACTAPGPPSALTAQSADTNVALQWQAPTTGVTQGYRIVAGSQPGLANLASIALPASPTAFAATAPFGTYFVRVQATNVCGVGAPSNEITLVVQPCTAAPAAPTNLRATVNGAQVTLLWDPPAAGARPSRYILVVGAAPGASNLLVTDTGSMTPAFSAAAPAGTYYVRMLSANACGQSAGTSNEILVVVP